jgi:hypothetical protein
MPSRHWGNRPHRGVALSRGHLLALFAAITVLAARGQRAPRGRTITTNRRHSTGVRAVACAGAGSWYRHHAARGPPGPADRRAIDRPRPTSYPASAWGTRKPAPNSLRRAPSALFAGTGPARTTFNRFLEPARIGGGHPCLPVPVATSPEAPQRGPPRLRAFVQADVRCRPVLRHTT